MVRGFRCEDNLQEIMCPKSFGGVRFDIILCMSCFNHVPSGDTLRQDAISSLLYLVVNNLDMTIFMCKYFENKFS